MPRPNPFVIPGILSRGRLDIHEIPIQNDLINSFSNGISDQGAPSFFLLAKGDIEIPCENYITLEVALFLSMKPPANLFFSIRIGSIDIENSYQGIRVLLPQQGEDLTRAILDVNSLKFLFIPQRPNASGCASRANCSFTSFFPKF